jgi:hypothetical protein
MHESGFKFSCSTDDAGKPFQDCLNAIAAFCNLNSESKDNYKQLCRSVVDQAASISSIYWQEFRRACGQWNSDDFSNPDGSNAYASLACQTATATLLKNGFFYDPKIVPPKVPLSRAVTDSITAFLWKNAALASS